MSEPRGAQHPNPSLTDSPWFWVMVFSAMSVVLLLVISPKYGRRQGRIELQYEARQEIARRQVEGTGATREPGEEGSTAPPAPGELIIPLWPLVMFFAALLTVAAGFLYRARRAMARSTTEADSGAAP